MVRKTLNVDEVIAYFEHELDKMVEGKPVPTRTQLFIDFGPNTSNTILRIRLNRPDLYARYQHLEVAAREGALRRVAEVVEQYRGREREARAQFKAIQAEYGFGRHTLCALREKARGCCAGRATWDWARIMAEVNELVARKDRKVLTLTDVASKFDPTYYSRVKDGSTPPCMSQHTLLSHLRRYPSVHQALLKLCAANRQRAKKKESK